MDQYELIRTAHRVYGKSIREIRRETGHHRETIRKALAKVTSSTSKRSMRLRSRAEVRRSFHSGPGGGSGLGDGLGPGERRMVKLFVMAHATRARPS